MNGHSSSDDDRPDTRETMTHKVIEKMARNLQQIEKSVAFARGLLSECAEKFEDLQSQMTELHSIVLGRRPEEQHGPSVTDIAEETPDLVIESDDASSAMNKRKKLRANPDQEEFHDARVQTADNSVTRTTQNAAGRPNSLPSTSRNENATATGSNDFKASDADAAKVALQKTKGILPSQDFDTFIYLCGQVDDPVQLARISFTDDIQKLYYQLMTFRFHLKNTNDAIEKEKGPSFVDRSLEDKLEILIQTFRADVRDLHSNASQSSDIEVVDSTAAPARPSHPHVVSRAAEVEIVDSETPAADFRRFRHREWNRSKHFGKRWGHK